MAGRSREAMMSMGMHVLPPEERHEACVRGGKKAQENLRRRRRMQEVAQVILQMKLQNADEIKAYLRAGGMPEEDCNYAAGIIMTQTLKAMSGDTKAAEFVRDTSGQKPTDSLVVGNLDDQPFELIDLGALSDAELKELAAIKASADEEYDEEE